MNKDLNKPSVRLDQHISRCLSERRVALGLTIGDLAARVDVEPEILRDAEAGTARMTASLLYQVAGVLRVPVSYFFPTPPDTDPDGLVFKAPPEK